MCLSTETIDKQFKIVACQLKRQLMSHSLCTLTGYITCRKSNAKMLMFMETILPNWVPKFPRSIKKSGDSYDIADYREMMFDSMRHPPSLASVQPCPPPLSHKPPAGRGAPVQFSTRPRPSAARDRVWPVNVAGECGR